jgi:predicted enzyme related to lactoylglutathione lyase
MPTICHFNVPAEDTEQAKKFYAELFGWKFEKYGPIEYYSITTKTLDDEEGFGGGLTKREQPQQTITVYIEVQSMDKYIAKVKKLGGRVLFPKTAVPNIGYTAVCIDTENNAFGLWETDQNAK